MKIVYLHGFASVGDSDKSRELVNRFGSDNVVCPNLPIDPNAVKDIISKIVKENSNFPIIFVGTSLGGFYANYFAQKYDALCVLVNPSTRPSKTFSNKLGAHKNHITGETLQITSDVINEWAAMEQYVADNQNDALISLFVAADDAVLDPAIALAAMPYVKHKVETPDGGHRFTSNWGIVLDHIATLR